jgi:hypothetical protein
VGEEAARQRHASLRSAYAVTDCSGNIVSGCSWTDTMGMLDGTRCHDIWLHRTANNASALGSPL